MQCLPSLKAKTAYSVWPRISLVHGQPGGVEVSGLLARAYVRRRQARGHSERRRCWVPEGPQGQAAGDRGLQAVRPFIKPCSPYPASRHIHETSLLYGLPLALLRQPTNTHGGRGFLALDSKAFSFISFFHTLKCVFISSPGCSAELSRHIPLADGFSSLPR